MVPNEPINLREWRATSPMQHTGRLFTCGRPGRATFGRRRCLVGDHTIDLWISGLPQAYPLHIVSLLGEKPDGFSEFGYYPFRSAKEKVTKLTFQEWLDVKYPERFVVHEFPTMDARAIPCHIRQNVVRHVLGLLKDGNSVVIIDSAGAERTTRVCQALGFTRL